MAIDRALSERLNQFGRNLAAWRLEAHRLRLAADAAAIAQDVETETLVEVERSAGVLYEEITAFKAVLVEVEKASPAAAGELGAVSDALHVLLLELTEIGTRLYSLKSGVTAAPELQIDRQSDLPGRSEAITRPPAEKLVTRG